MVFLSSAWLIALLPWGAVCIWMLIGRRVTTSVPFLHLWPAGFSAARSGRRYSVPPLFVVLMLVASAAAILASASPVLMRGPRRLSVPVVVIADRGLSMSARLSSGKLRFAEAALELQKYLPAGQDIQFISAPGRVAEQLKIEHLPAELDHAGASGAQTADAVSALIASALARSDHPLVIALTDHPIANSSALRILPAEAISDVGIALLAARTQPHSQSMISLRNQSSLKHVALVVETDGHAQMLEVELPPPGHTRDYFVDVPSIGQIIKAHLDVRDALALDDSAWLVRGALWPRLEVRSPLSTSLARMVQTYQRLRPPDQLSQSVQVLTIDQPTEITAPAVWAAGDGAASKPAATTRSDQPIRVRHPEAGPRVTQIDWNSALSRATFVGPPTGDWTPLIIANGSQIAVAFRESPARQVWVGFSSEAFERTADYVVFWGAVFDWLGAGGDQFGGGSPHEMEGRWDRIDGPAQSAVSAGWLPGLYRGSDGTLYAINAFAPKFEPAPTTDDRQRLDDFVKGHSRSEIALSGWTSLFALAMMIAAICLIRRRRLYEVHGAPPSHREGHEL